MNESSRRVLQKQNQRPANQRALVLLNQTAWKHPSPEHLHLASLLMWGIEEGLAGNLEGRMRDEWLMLDRLTKAGQADQAYQRIMDQEGNNYEAMFLRDAKTPRTGFQ